MRKAMWKSLADISVIMEKPYKAVMSFHLLDLVLPCMAAWSQSFFC